MQADHAEHDLAYQRKRVDHEYAGWIRHNEVAGDWHHTWQPPSQKQAFPDQGNLLELGCGAGNLGIAFAQVGYPVTGVDMRSPGQLKMLLKPRSRWIFFMVTF